MRGIWMVTFFLALITGAFGQTGNKPLKITRLTGDFYIFETWHSYKGSPVSANAMYVVTSAGVVLFDTPWDSTQFQPLLDSISAKHHKKVILCLSTHFHADRTGGLEYYRKRHIRTYSTRKTDELSKTHGMKRAEFLMNKDTVFTVGQYRFQTFFPGPGHTADNIVIWFDKEKILYGGCLIKSADAKNLGNLDDGDTKAYASTIEKVIRTCPHPKYIIPGHDNWTNQQSLNHTLALAKALAGVSF